MEGNTTSTYFVHINRNAEQDRVLHFWSDATQDTACRLLSTGGLDTTKRSEFHHSLDTGVLCHMRRAHLLKLITQQRQPDDFPGDSAEDQAAATHLRDILQDMSSGLPAPVIRQLTPQVRHDGQLIPAG
jgi:hypothetical protein